MPGAVIFVMTAANFGENKGICLSSWHTMWATDSSSCFSFVKLDSHAFIFMLLAIRHYVLIRLTTFFWREKILPKLPHASQRRKNTPILSLTGTVARFKMLVLLYSKFLFICMQLFVKQKCFQYIVGGVCVHLLIYFSFESKVCLFIKHEPCHLKIPQKILTLRTAS